MTSVDPVQPQSSRGENAALLMTEVTDLMECGWKPVNQTGIEKTFNFPSSNKAMVYLQGPRFA